MIKDLKIKDPISFQVGTEFCTCTLKGKRYYVNEGLKFEEEHYGFILENQKEKKTYPTSAPIKGAMSTKLFFHIFEEGKKGSWKINVPKGKVIQHFEEETQEKKL